MKSLLSYYYGMNVEKIIKKNNNYYFTYKLDHYIFSKIEIDKYKYDNLYRMNMELLKYNSLFHKIMINNYNSIITPVDKGNYILFKVNLRKNRKISIIDILQISKPIFLPKNIIANMDYSNWTDLWKKKINYLEYYVENKVGKNYLLTELLNYFIGIGENAITYIKDTTEQNNRFINNVVIEHDRINKNDTLWDLYNPLNIVFDNRVRDISEYFKDNMIKTICSDDWIKKNIAMCKFNTTEI